MTRALACCLALLTAPALVGAQPVSDEAVDARLRRGFELRRAGDDASAVEQFQAAYQMRPEGRTAAQLGLVLQATGRWIDAEGLLREALAAASDPWVTRNRPALEGALAVVDRHLGTLEIVDDGGGLPPGAEVRVNRDRVATASLGQPLRVVAGQLVLEVIAPGFDPLVRRIEIAPGERLRERVALVRTPVRETVAAPASLAAPAASAPPPRAREPVVAAPHVSWRAVAIASGSLAVASLAAGVAAMLVRGDAASSFNASCDERDVDGDCGRWRAQTHFSEGVAVVSFPVAALALGLGVVAWVRGGASGAPARASACGVSMAGAHCGWRF